MTRAGAPLDFVTEYGQDPPMCTQFSVFLNKDAKCNLRSGEACS